MRPKKSVEKLDSREQELMMLRKVAEYVSSNLELEELLSRIVKMVAEITSADSCFIYL
jgi:GAF domain-containing protein